jgi:hypothetical protein
MKVVIKKNSKESNERCISRFTKLVQASRKVLRLKSSRYHSRKATKRQVRAGAVVRERYRAKRRKTAFMAINHR